MAQPAGRGLMREIFKNFINSFKPRQIVGDLRGTDYFGNKFYEIAANPSAGKRKPSRWFVPPGKDDFDQEMSVEWESWLRFRRSDPPTEQELLQNLRIMQLKKKNAIEVEKKAGKPTPMLKGMETFPQRPEYEIVPGKERKP